MKPWHQSCDLAWAAGLYEGEGSTLAVDVHANKRYVYLRVQIGMTDLEPLEKMRTLFGGRIYGPYLQVRSSKPIYSWRLQEQEGVRRFICQMYRHLSPRRREQMRVAWRRSTWKVAA
jgi:hypothetical protein